MKHKLAFVAAVAAIGLIFTTPAFANGSGSAPVVATNSDSTGPGGSLTVTGNNFYPGEEITLELYSDPVAIGQTNADSAGSFSIVVTIPTDATPGSHSIVANGSSGDSANTAIVVTGTNDPVAPNSGTTDPVVTTSSSPGPGGSLTVTGNNFRAGEEITVELYSDPVAVGQTNADSTGSFSIVVTIPTDVTPGSHSIVANGSSGDSANTAIVVTGTIVSVTAKIVPAASKSGLPLTGANIAMVSEVGVLAMALGGMLIVSTRRPRRTA